MERRARTGIGQFGGYSGFPDVGCYVQRKVSLSATGLSARSEIRGVFAEQYCITLEIEMEIIDAGGHSTADWLLFESESRK